MSDQPDIEKCIESIKIICEGNNDSTEVIKHKANWLYMLNRLDFFKDLPILIELIEYERMHLPNKRTER